MTTKAETKPKPVSRSKDTSALTYFFAYEIERRRELGDTYDEIAEFFEVSKPTVSNVHHHLNQVGAEIEKKIAKLLAGGSRDKLSRLVADWRATHPRWVPERQRPPANKGLAGWDEACEEYLAEAKKNGEPRSDWAVLAAGEMPALGPLRPGQRVSVSWVRALVHQVMASDWSKEEIVDWERRANAIREHKTQKVEKRSHR